MAQKVTIALEDDLDGGPADETVRFGLGGAEYEIDLSAKNARAFRAQLAPFVEHARKTGRHAAGRPARTAAGRQRSVEIRAWAREHGIAVSDRGRIPASVAERYQAAAKRRFTQAAMATALASGAGSWHGARPVPPAVMCS